MLCRPDMRDFRFFLAILTARSVNTRARSGAVPLAGLECAGDADSGLEPAQRGAEGPGYDGVALRAVCFSVPFAYPTMGYIPQCGI